MNVYVVFRIMDEGADVMCDVAATQKAAEAYIAEIKKYATDGRYYIVEWTLNDVEE